MSGYPSERGRCSSGRKQACDDICDRTLRLSSSRRPVDLSPCRGSHDSQVLDWQGKEEVEIFSNTVGDWVRGWVDTPVEPGFVTVLFALDGQTLQKSLKPDSPNIRPAAARSQTSRRSTSRSQTSRSRAPPTASNRLDGVAPSKSFLKDISLFHQLPDDELQGLANAFSKEVYKHGEALITQGDEGDTFFVIARGEVSVLSNNRIVAKLGPGDYFGEQALLNEVPRNATIMADEEVTTLVLLRDRFLELGLREKLCFQKREAVHAGADGWVPSCAPSHKTVDERKLIFEAIQFNKNLSDCVQLSGSKINQMIDVAWKEPSYTGNQLIKEGDSDANYFYIVQEGTFKVSVASNSRICGVDTKLVPGDSFGELALLHPAKRAATVTATTDGYVWVIDRLNFQAILSRSAEDIARQYVRCLNRSLFDFLNEDEKLNIARALIERTCPKGEQIIEQGAAGDAFYVLYDGQVEVVKDGTRVSTLTGDRGQNEAPIFGERALLTNEPRAATVTVTSDTATVLYMDKASFQMVLPHMNAFGRQKRTSSRCSFKQTIRWDDIQDLGMLGCGGFGAVSLVEHQQTKAVYALKALSKGYVVKSGMQKSVLTEKTIQHMLNDSEFIVKLLETYNRDQSLYFLLELAGGGELYATYNRKGLHGSLRHAQYYVAGTVFAFEHMHQKKVIHRDLKPENLLLTDEGHVKLADFGLSKIVAGKTFTTCGTPDYFAPELINKSGHTFAVDWWTLGVLTFELMAGYTPFHASSPAQMYAKVIKGISTVTFPAKLGPVFKDFVSDLCKQDPSLRLPMLKGGSANIKDHSWYAGFDWKAMQDLSLKPPYFPPAKNLKDKVQQGLQMPPQVPYKDDDSGWDADFATSE